MHRSPERFVPVLAVVLAIALSADPTAAQQRELAIPHLTARSEIVVVGSVTGTASRWNEGGTRILTEVTIRVEQTLKGAVPSGTLTVLVPGGEVGDVGELYSHVPRFRQDERVVVFAARDRSGTFRVTGGEQGKLSIRREERSGTNIVDTGEVLEAFTARVRQAAADENQR